MGPYALAIVLTAIGLIITAVAEWRLDAQKSNSLVSIYKDLSAVALAASSHFYYHFSTLRLCLYTLVYYIAFVLLSSTISGIIRGNMSGRNRAIDEFFSE